MSKPQIHQTSTGARFAYVGDYTVRAQSGADDAVVLRDIDGDEVLIAVCQPTNGVSALDIAITYASVLNGADREDRMSADRKRSMYWRAVGMAMAAGCPRVADCYFAAVKA
jgi:hypothetical protein